MCYKGRICFADWDSKKVQVYEKSYQPTWKGKTADTARKAHQKAQIEKGVHDGRN